MLHIFADASAMKEDGTLRITGGDLNHMKNVCRLVPGDEVIVGTGGDDREYRYGIERYGQDERGADFAELRLRFVKDANVELPVRVVLYQGLPKADKMDLIVRKCVELGVCEIVPTVMERSIVRLDEQKAARKVQRWQAIAESAAGQSRRRILPQVHLPMPMQEAIADAATRCSVLLLPYELQPADKGTREVLSGIRPGDRVAVFIGPEGGFTPEEVQAARQSGAAPISLGRRILRTETAGMTFLSFLIYQFEIS